MYLQLKKRTGVVAFARLVAVVGKSLCRRALGAGVLLGVGQLAGGNALALVVGGTLGLAALLQTVGKQTLAKQNIDETVAEHFGWEHTEQQHPGTSSRPRGSDGQRCSTCGRAAV